MFGVPPSSGMPDESPGTARRRNLDPERHVSPEAVSTGTHGLGILQTLHGFGQRKRPDFVGVHCAGQLKLRHGRADELLDPLESRLFLTRRTNTQATDVSPALQRARANQ